MSISRFKKKKKILQEIYITLLYYVHFKILLAAYDIH